MRILVLRRALLGIGAAAILAGCGGAQPPTMAHSDQALARPQLGRHYWLYVVNKAGNTVTAYHWRGSKAILSIKQLSPSAIAFGDRGRIFVATDTQPGSVGVYGMRHGESKGTITKGIDGPKVLVADRAFLFVANSSSSGSYVSAYRQRDLTLLRTFDKTTDGITAMATDNQGYLYVASTKYIRVYTRIGKLLRTITKGITCPGSLAFDNSDYLYVANYIAGATNCSGKITVYEFGFTRLIRVISKGLAGPVAMTFEGTNELWVANNLNNTVTAYSQRQAPDFVFSTGISAPTGVAILYYLYVSSNGSGNGWLTVYKVPQKSPLKTITDKIDGPVAIELR